MTAPAIPLATYRLQFNRNFTFAQATEIIPYLAALGISHCYASPYLRARPGSMHGYDIIDHYQLNPEIGTPEEYDRFVETLHQHNMGQILDIVPNHMGVMGADNVWWLDVLENGEASNYAGFFDIDWEPLKDELQGKVLVPVLDGQYGDVLDKGDLKLAFDSEKGEFSIFYYQHKFPIDPREYPFILRRQVDRLTEALGADNQDLLELQSLTAAFGHLPTRMQIASDKKAERNRDKEIHKRRLATLCGQSPQIADFIQENVAALNGTPGNSRSFDELHELIKSQAFRLAYWRVASDDINYRRFFDINDLAGIRMENPDVFEATHRLILELIRDGKVNGLRIDHPDGLFNPAKYFEQLQAGSRVYLVVEKILSGDEPLPAEWPVHGTTGYDFSNLVNGLFVDSSAASKIERAYRGFLGEAEEFREVLHHCKKNVMRNALASELNVLANLLSRIALSNRHTCDFTLNSLRYALSEIVAHFPVYRTYLTEESVSPRDREYIDIAIDAAKNRARSQDTSVFDFIHRVLTTREGDEPGNVYRRAFITFAMKFQQFTSPVQAKGLEDTAFYRYHPLMSINDVGADPLEFGVTLEEFHRKTALRAREWPVSMLATSTHDSKLAEDVRARINVLSEIPGRWRLKARQWRLMNRDKKSLFEGGEAPSRNDEYLFYQVLIGTWPTEGEQPTAELRERLKNYMLKAAREAKQVTSWANQNAVYEGALGSFVEGVLDPSTHSEFIADFSAFHGWIARVGMVNSLSQVLIKLTSPGVPDIYQGSELSEFRLVDPDNHQPIDFARRQKMLCEMISLAPPQLPDFSHCLADKFVSGQDREGRSKLYLTWRALGARQRHAELFQRGVYVPLNVEGNAANHLIAYARVHGEDRAIIAAPRMATALVEESGASFTRDFWRETRLVLPAEFGNSEFMHCLTGEREIRCHEHNGGVCLELAGLLDAFPWLLLSNSPSSIS